jgi:nicotinamidase-related amidase
MTKPVLIVIDMLNDFLCEWDSGSRRWLTRAINELMDVMRSQGWPVIWVRQEFEPDLSDAFPEMRAKGIWINIRGTEGCEIIPELTVESGDVVIVKKRYSAFFGTGLDEVLGRLGADTVILAGINTHACVRMTAIDAYQRDMEVVLAVECIDSYDREHHEVSLRYMKDKIAAVMTNEEIASLWR